MFTLNLIKQFIKEYSCAKEYWKIIKSQKEPIMPPNENPNDDMKMYVIINRSKLSLVQCGVQAGHALAEYGNEYGRLFPYTEWVTKHKTLIFLEATNEENCTLISKFIYENMNFRSFYEPDMDNMWTATAFQPVSSEEGRRLFGHLKLLK